MTLPAPVFIALLLFASYGVLELVLRIYDEAVARREVRELRERRRQAGR